MDGKILVLLLLSLMLQDPKLHQDEIYILDLVLECGIISIRTSEKQQINNYSLACQIAIDPPYATPFPLVLLTSRIQTVLPKSLRYKEVLIYINTHSYLLNSLYHAHFLIFLRIQVP